jgi:hypothetical protein
VLWIIGGLVGTAHAGDQAAGVKGVIAAQSRANLDMTSKKSKVAIHFASPLG